MKLGPFLVAVAYFIVVIVIAHFFAPPGYDWTQNTISDLGSQGHKYKWIMQAGFLGFGLILSLGVGYHFLHNERQYFLLLVALYGLCISVTGIFCAAPIDPSIPSSASEASLHSLFATIAGLGLSLAILWQVAASANNHEKIFHFIFLLLVMGISALFGLAENGGLPLSKGIVQRFLYLSGLAWLVYQEWLLLGNSYLLAASR